MQDLSYKFTIHRPNIVKISLGDILTLNFFKYTVFKEEIIFSQIIFNFFFLKIDFITLDSDPDPNSMYLDPQH